MIDTLARRVLPFVQAGLLLCVLAPVRVAAQGGPPPAAVRYTEARSHEVRRNITLPGTVEALTVSPVAAEVAGLMVDWVAREGTAVALDDPIARLRTDNLELALRARNGELKEARARLERAERVLNRARGLHEQGLLSDGDLDEAVAEFRAWEGRIERLEAEIDRLELDLERCTVRAPVSGVVIAEHTDIGAWVDVGEPVVEVLSLDQFKVRMDVPEKYFALIRVGEPATVTVGSDEPFRVEGEVTAVIPSADPRSRVFPVKVNVPNREGRLAAGMLAEVSVAVGDPVTAVIVPKDALVTQGPAQFVFAINEQGMVNRVQVRPGMGMGDWIVVEGDVPAGTRVVTRGNERLFPGMQVQGEVQEYPLP